MATPDAHMIKVRTILRWITAAEDAGTPAQKESLIAQCGAVWGTARQTAQSYLRELYIGNKIIIKEENIWTTERFQKIQQAQALTKSNGDKK